MRNLLGVDAGASSLMLTRRASRQLARGGLLWLLLLRCGRLADSVSALAQVCVLLRLLFFFLGCSIAYGGRRASHCLLGLSAAAILDRLHLDILGRGTNCLLLHGSTFFGHVELLGYSLGRGTRFNFFYLLRIASMRLRERIFGL